MKEYFINIVDSFFVNFQEFNCSINRVNVSNEEFQNYLKISGLEKLVNNLKKQYNHIMKWLEEYFFENFNSNFQEFIYDIKYINFFIKNNETIMDRAIFWYEFDNYKMKGFFLFLYSLLDKIVLLNYLDKNQNNSELIKKISEVKNQEDAEKTLKFFKKISFTNKNYNIHLEALQKSTLWLYGINIKRNWDMHWPQVAQIINPNEIHNIADNYYINIYLTLFLFLWYLKTYALK
ncbi:hypothetical protein [Spiroplasma chrysopicola]|uniref:Uncharacterized protein n=1 Tax=Spiroplasma chrysopicola DF-1 TaxID=1276227 RepID=R4UJJ1_9MOLU|nr:hypothetical protein [Spiroplasma chrysopicola]AGM25476.1 hypothetical protein SCHRY_v1c09030 [Spiroplasma chrysopicola DF-1]